MPLAKLHPQLTELESRVLRELADHGPTHDLGGAIRGRLALYQLIDETPTGWTITALGRETLRSGAQRVSAEEDEKPLRHISKGKRHYGRKQRKRPVKAALSG